MFIDYVTLMLVNMAAALVLLAVYVMAMPEAESRRSYAAGFGLTGLVAAVMGAHLCWAWPLPGPYNAIFGEMSVLLGALLLGAALATGCGWTLRAVAICALPAGAAAMLLGVRIMDLGLTKSPKLSGAGFILTGGGGMLVGLMLLGKARRGFRFVAAVPLLAGAAIWLFTAGTAYWGHLERWQDWMPLVFQRPPA
jgi:putative membrane protein